MDAEEQKTRRTAVAVAKNLDTEYQRLDAHWSTVLNGDNHNQRLYAQAMDAIDDARRRLRDYDESLSN